MDATREGNTNGHETTTIRWQDDEQHSESQLAHGWTEEYCKYLDHLKMIDIEYTAAWKQTQIDTKVPVH